MPKVSVIIPVYNVERYLGECLDSILGQTLKDIEVLCVDDGSTDDSAKILAEYAAKDARVKLFSSPHAGAFRAREVGVNAAAGEYIYFMDADDLLEVGAFKELCARNADSVVSYTPEAHPVRWHKYLDPDGAFVEIFGDSLANRQELRTSYYPNGAVYVFRTALIRERRYYSDRSYAYVMPRSRSVDIDTLDDFDLAEFLMRRNRQMAS